MSAPKPPPSLLAFQRSVARYGSQAKQPGKLRWSAEVYEGKPFVSARIWTLGSNGDEYPTEKGITIRASEIDQVIDALCKVRDRMRAVGPPNRPA